MRFWYNVQVDSRVKESEELFGAEVERILGLERGWRRWGFSFVRAYPDARGAAHMRKRRTISYFTLTLAPNAQIRKFGKDFDGMSVADCHNRKIYINADRWATGAKNRRDAVRDMPLAAYRQYVILHEVGHILSDCSATHHQTRCAPCGRAPIMMQQTNGVGACAWNPWPVEGVDDIEPRELLRRSHASS